MNQVLKIAVQKSGRLNEGSLALLKECGISVDNNRKDMLIAKAFNFPLEVLYLRDDDIPQYVEDGVADVGIVGLNVVNEKGKNTELVKKLGFSKCHLSLALPKHVGYTGLQQFNGKKIATSYPNTLSKFLKDNDLHAEIHEISGSVEIAPAIGLADAICDLVSSGSTLFSNGLKEVHNILDSEAVMVATANLDPEKKKILDKLIFRINAIMKARSFKYIILNAPENKVENIAKILPGMKSPTVTPLKEKGWVALHSVVAESDFWEVIDKLKEEGAEGILVVPIEKMI